MFLPSAVKVFIATTPADMRNSIDGLCSLVTRMEGDVFSGNLFVFLSKRADRVKILTWDNGGFVIYYKRLEKGCFKHPHFDDTSAVFPLDSTQLAMLLDGVDVMRVRRPKKWKPPNAA
jgi:transposase